ncbi:hypothetical protein BS17DRAFT_160414 [Gyrodon lividus]|nr:hypothetical protein BS17DRAFT_160414 [Gyrodon lividus]
MFHQLIPPTSHHNKSYAYLSARRQTNSDAPRYCSETTRHALSANCETRTGRKPYPWQLDCSEACNLGMDCVILAGTGFGKTLPFTIPALLHPDKITIVLSPLNALEEDQARRFRQVGLKTAVVNHETFDSKLYQMPGSSSLTISAVRAYLIFALTTHS